MEQNPPVFSVMVERAGGERREKMAKFLIVITRYKEIFRLLPGFV
jgi:hypothetical protein